MHELHDVMKQMAGRHTQAKNLIAKCGIKINYTVDEDWEASVDPVIVEEYMLGSRQFLIDGKAAASHEKKTLTVESLRTRV